MTLLLAMLLACIEPASELAAESPPSIEQGRAAYGRGEYANAAAIFEQRALTEPASPALRLDLARCLWGAGRRGDAIATVSQVHAQHPLHLPALRLLWQFRAASETPWTASEGFEHLIRGWFSAEAGLAWLGLAVLFGGVTWLWPEQRRLGRRVVLAAGLIGLATLILAVYTWTVPRPRVVVTVPRAVLRIGCGTTYPPALWLGRPIVVSDGAAGSIQAQRPNGWLQVAFGSGRIGWLPGEWVRPLGEAALSGDVPRPPGPP